MPEITFPSLPTLSSLKCRLDSFPSAPPLSASVRFKVLKGGALYYTTAINSFPFSLSLCTRNEVTGNKRERGRG